MDGSFSTISAHLAEWKAEHAGQAAADIPAMPEKVQAAFQQIWALAARSAQKEVETKAQALEAMHREMDKDRAEMSGEIQRLERALEETHHRAGELETTLNTEREAGQEKDQQVTTLQIENARLDERAAELKAQLGDLQAKFADVAKTAQGSAGKKNRARNQAVNEEGPAPRSDNPVLLIDIVCPAMPFAWTRLKK